MQFLNLYPEKTGLLIGLTNGLTGAGSFFPLAWKTFIDDKLISYSGIMWIWFGLSLVSLVLGTLIYPWHNLPQDLSKGRPWSKQALDGNKVTMVELGVYSVKKSFLTKTEQKPVPIELFNEIQILEAILWKQKCYIYVT